MATNFIEYHPENLAFTDVFSILRTGIGPAGSDVTETDRVTPRAATFHFRNFVTLLTMALQKFLIWISTPLGILGDLIEFILNFYSMNGGIFGIIRRLSVVIPKKGSPQYRSIVGHIDGRTDLYKVTTGTHAEGTDTVTEVNQLELCIMASKIAYENKAYVENVVTNIWKMHLVMHDDFWNETLQSADTQAFICCDRAENAQLIVVAFRGTEPFCAKDWITDIDLSLMRMGEMGGVHSGFMKALGAQDVHDYKKGWPKEYKGEQKLAYYSIRDKLKELLKKNKSARILITGHSLGGALATLFPAILLFHNEDGIMDNLFGVFTFGQPRVGDKDFGEYMKPRLNMVSKRYHRVVFRYDIVPRIPFDVPLSGFKHFGDCLYYGSWYKGEVMSTEINPNYFDPRHIIPKFWNAHWDFLRGLFAGSWHGKDFQESLVSILYRALGLPIPGVASHSTRDYVNSARLATITVKGNTIALFQQKKPLDPM